VELGRVIIDVADALKNLDDSRITFKTFHPGIGPFGEPQLVKLVAAQMNELPRYSSSVTTMRTPDLLVCRHWALEIKLARPYGDNDRLAENWSVNLLHPYAGSTSLLGDCLKLRMLPCKERKGVLAIGYEHEPARLDLEPLWRAFELVASGVLNLNLGPRIVARRKGLIHPVHQQVIVVGWELT
jgi:hypothetical protein